MLRAILATSLLLLLTGCHAVEYRAPGAAAEMSLFGGPPTTKDKLTDPAVREVLVREPLAMFPAGLAVARVQGPGYSNYCTRAYGTGAYSVVTSHEIETPKDFERLEKLPMVRSVAPISQLLLPSQLETSLELRSAAGSLGADMLLVYTFDTQYKSDDLAPPLMVITLGLFPTNSIHVTTTASAVLLDVRNGFVYGSMEASSKRSSISNAWTDDAAVDSARKHAEREALDGLLDRMEKTWPQIVVTYNVPRTLREPQPVTIWAPQWEPARRYPEKPEGTRYRTSP